MRKYIITLKIEKALEDTTTMSLAYKEKYLTEKQGSPRGFGSFEVFELSFNHSPSFPFSSPRLGIVITFLFHKTSDCDGG